jgi:hypothetical protein
LTSYTLEFALQLRKKQGKTSVRVAARTSQTQYNSRTMNSTKHRRKMSQSNKEHRIHNRENSPYQVSKPCVKILNQIDTVQYTSHQT